MPTGVYERTAEIRAILSVAHKGKLLSPEHRASLSIAQMGHTPTHKSHGMSYSRTYKSWIGMKQRCLNTHASNYQWWGGRGISVCARWLGKDGFINFLADMGERPLGLSLDRIDNNGNYEPGNCKWSTPKEQANNQRHTKKGCQPN